jgi:ribosome-binding factor A
MNMAKIRNHRVAEQIKKELGSIIQREMKDPRIGFITVTGVEVTNDLSQAKIYISVMGSLEQKENSLHALEKAQGFLRSEIGKRILLRHVPELIFKIDESIEYGNRIESLITQLKQERKDENG